MINPNKISVKTKIIITISVIWILFSLFISTRIAVNNDYGHFFENIKTLLTSFLIFTAPVWICWSLFLILEGVINKLFRNFFTRCDGKFTKIKFNILHKLLYGVFYGVITFLALGIFSIYFMAPFSKELAIDKEAVGVLKILGIEKVTKDEMKVLKTKIRKHNGNFYKLWGEKDFRSILLKNEVLEINKYVPIKIDEITQITEVSTDRDRTLSYHYKINFAYEEKEGQEIYNKIINVSKKDIIEYWCGDDKVAAYRQMKAIIEYIYFDKEMKLMGKFTLNIKDDCTNL